MKSPFALLAIALALSAAAPAFADDAPAAAPAADATPPADPLSFNISVTSDYRYRGISQTRLKPALQGGADYADPSGWYVGTWLSTIKWIKDAGGDAPVEWDLYGGYKTEIATGLTLDVGVLQYEYVHNKLTPSANTFEIYGALSYGPVTAKLSHSLTNLFGFADSKGSDYLDVSANFDVGGGVTLTPDIAHQTVHDNPTASYSNYSLTAAKDYAGFTWSAQVIGTNANKAAYTYAPTDKFLGKTALVVAVKKTF